MRVESSGLLVFTLTVHVHNVMYSACHAHAYYDPPRSCEIPGTAQKEQDLKPAGAEDMGDLRRSAAS